MEWEDGQDLKTGRILSKRNVDSPLLSEDEWVFKMDPDADVEKLNKVKELIGLIPQEQLPTEVKTFMVRQLS